MSGSVKKNYIRPLDIRNGRVDMGHGAGGRAAAQLIEELFVAAFDNEWLRQGNDGAVFTPPLLPAGARLVMATDAHVVSPLFFPGGDVGCLSVHGTVNDLAMSGATPLYLTASFVLEEGLPLAELKRVIDSMAAASREAGVPIVTGDTKVVERGKGDGVFISTTGLGVIAPGVDIGGANARVGDVILLSGTVGDHGVAVLSQRESLEFETTIESDTAALHGLVADMLAAAPGACMCCATLPGAAWPPRSMRSPASPAREYCCRKRRFPCCPRWMQRASCWDWIRSTSPMKASSLPFVHPKRPIRYWPSCARTRVVLMLHASAW